MGRKKSRKAAKRPSSSTFHPAELAERWDPCPAVSSEQGVPCPAVPLPSEQPGLRPSRAVPLPSEQPGLRPGPAVSLALQPPGARPTWAAVVQHVPGPRPPPPPAASPARPGPRSFPAASPAQHGPGRRPSRAASPAQHGPGPRSSLEAFPAQHGPGPRLFLEAFPAQHGPGPRSSPAGSRHQAGPDEPAEVGDARLRELMRRKKELYDSRAATDRELKLVEQDIAKFYAEEEEDMPRGRSSSTSKQQIDLWTKPKLSVPKAKLPPAVPAMFDDQRAIFAKEQTAGLDEPVFELPEEDEAAAGELDEAAVRELVRMKYEFDDSRAATARELKPIEQEMAKLKCSDAGEEDKEEEELQEDEMARGQLSSISKHQTESTTKPSLSLLSSHSTAFEFNQPQLAIYDLDESRAARELKLVEQEKNSEHEMDAGKSKYMISQQQIEELCGEMEGPVSKEIELLYEELMTSTEEDEVSTDGDEDKMDRGKSNSMISMRQIEKLCEDMEIMLSYLRWDIKPAAPLSELTEDDAEEALPPTIHAILEQFKNLRRHMSKLRLQLQPFKERYEEEQAKLDSFEGLDKEEKIRKKIEMEEKFFNIYRRSTESSYRRVVFEQQTTLSPMYFTHWTPGQILPYYAETQGISLQVYSFKITKIKGNLCWPLKVYGIVAARDNSDRKRNIIFNRLRHDCQEIFSDDPFLRLTGPSRAIMALSPVNFEVQLKLKGVAESEDRALMNLTEHYVRGISNTIMFGNCLCKAELRTEELSNSVQATFLGVRVVDGSCPFEYGGRIACSSPPREVVQMDEKAIAHFVVDSRFQVVLLDSRHCVRGKMPIGKDGCLDLSRRFVSVELQKENYRQFKECLAVVFEAYSESGGIAAQAHVRIKPRTCNISHHTCDLGGSKVEITIAWSAIVRTDLC